MYGIALAFKDFSIKKGIMGSPWAGTKYFEQFFKSPNLWLLLKNTLGLSIYQLIAGFPLPIILALALNEVKSTTFKKSIQLVTYAPHFISTVVMVGMIIEILSPRSGFVNVIIQLLGFDAVNFMGETSMFSSIYVWSGVWQSMGYSAIIYIAALSGIDPALYEAAIIDGANRYQKMRHIDFPGIMPTIVILLILNVGNIMNLGFEKVYLLQNPLNLSNSEIINTYVYKVGLIGGQYSFSTAVSFFNSVINLILLVSVNQIAKKVGETSLW
jgi:putative aldouronate transport system permease protein